jgi:DNA-binding PadR family transcriptional regulator
MTEVVDDSSEAGDPMAVDPVDAGSARAERRRPSRAGRGGSLLELALLGVLAEGPQHGYELKKRLDGVLPVWSSVSFGSLYPTLGRLERAGDVVAATPDLDADDSVGDDSVGDDAEGSTAGDPDGSGIPMTGTLAGELAAFRARLRDRSSRPGRPRRTTRGQRGQRGRKAYTITAAGRARLHELLTSLDPADDRTFALQVAFAAHLETAERLAVLGQRRGELIARLDRASTAAEPTDPWRASLRRHSVATVAADIAWVDSLLAVLPLFALIVSGLSAL